MSRPKRRALRLSLACVLMCSVAASGHAASLRHERSGVYPHLAYFNSQDECGTIRVEADIDGNDTWKTCKSFDVPPGETVEHRFPDAFGAYWVRTVTSQDAIATAQLVYE